jgi:hypothetical protein
VLRGERADHPARGRHGSVGRRGAGRGRRAQPGAPGSRPQLRPAALADRGRGGRDDRTPAHPGRGKRADVPARPGRVGAVADRRQHRDQRRRPARVPLRRDAAVGDGARSRARSGPPRAAGRSRTQGCGRLRHDRAADRIRGHAWRCHGGMAAAGAGARRTAGGGRGVCDGQGGLRGDRTDPRQRNRGGGDRAAGRDRRTAGRRGVSGGAAAWRAAAGRGGRDAP